MTNALVRTTIAVTKMNGGTKVANLLVANLLVANHYCHHHNH
jgi:hypothetical protein